MCLVRSELSFLMSSQSPDLSLSILAQQINSFGPCLAKLCTDLMSELPKGEDDQNGTKFRQYIHKLNFEDDIFYKFITSCSLFAISKPKEGYIEFLRSLPKIDHKSNEPSKPENSGIKFFISTLKDVDFSSSKFKSFLKFFVCKCVSEFVIELTKRSAKFSESDIDFIIEDVLRRFVDNDFDIYMKIFAEEGAKLFKTPFQCMSEIYPTVVSKQMLKAFNNPKITTETSYNMYIIFSQIKIAKYEDVKEVLQRSVDIFVACPKEMEIHNVLGYFLVNILRQNLEMDPNFCENPMISRLYNISLKFCQNSNSPEVGFPLVALLSNYIKTKNKIRTYEEFIDSFIEPLFKTNALASSVLRAMVIKSKMYPPKDLYEIKDWVFSHLDLIKNTKKYFANAISEFIYYHFEEMTDEYMRMYLDPKIDVDISHRIAFLEAFHYVIVNKEKYSINFEKIQSIIIEFILTTLKQFPFDSKGPTVLYITRSFTGSLQEAAEEKEIFLKKMIINLAETSKPIFKIPSPQIDITKELKEWERFADHSLRNIFQPYFMFQQAKECPPKTEADILIIHLIKVAVLLKFNDTILFFICKIISVCSPYCGALAIRAIQARIHSEPQYTDQIICSLSNELLSQDNSFNQITILIYALCEAMKATYYELVHLKDSTVSLIRLIALASQCIPIPYIREQAFKIYEVISLAVNDNPKMIRYFSNYQDKVNKHAMNSLMHSIKITNDSMIKHLPEIKFTDISFSNAPPILVFYLSSTGFFFSAETNSTKSHASTRPLINFLISCIERDIDHVFSLNCLALLVSICDTIKLTPNDINQISELSKKFTKHILATEPSPDIKLIGIFSSLSSNLNEIIIPMLIKFDYIFLKSSTRIISQQIQDHRFFPLDNEGNIKCYVEALFQTILEFIISQKLVSEKLDFDLPKKKIDDCNRLIFLLYDFFFDLEYVLNLIFEINYPKQVFLTKPTYILLSNPTPFDNERWFIFLSNMSAYKEWKFGKLVLLALAAWLRISEIPDEYFQPLLYHISDLSIAVPSLTPPILGKYMVHCIKIYIAQARTKFSMFKGITGQVVSYSTIDSIIAHSPDHFIMSERPVISFYYKNCGSILALCMFHLTSKQYSHREAAFHLILSLVIMTMLVRNDKASAVSLLKSIKSYQSSISSAYSVFIQHDINQLNEILAEHFRFCSEQFINECFQIAKESTTKERNSKSIHTSSTESEKQYACQKIMFNIKSHDFSQPTSSRISLLGPILQRSPSQIQPIKIESVDINKSTMMMRFVSSWVIPFSYDLENPGISPLCEQEFQQFSVYSFIKSLLSICEIEGFTESLAELIDCLIEASPSLLILCLFFLQNKSEESLRCSIFFLLYIYNKLPGKIIWHLYEYLRVVAWFFFDVQISKVDQLFDMETYFENLSGKRPKHRRKTDERIDGTQNELDYVEVTDFVIKLTYECFCENPALLAPVMSFVVIFGYIQYPNYMNPINLLFSEIFANKKKKKKRASRLSSRLESIIVKKENSKTWKTSDVIQYLKQLVGEKEETILLEWGLCCGDIVVAKRAIWLFNELGFVIKPNAISSVLRSMQIVASTFNQRIELKGIDQDKIMQFSYMVGNKPDYHALTKYISTCLDLLLNFIRVNDRYQYQNILLTAIKFLSCSAEEYSSIYTSSLKIIDLFVENAGDIQIGEQYKDEHLVISLLKLKLSDNTALEMIFDIILKIMNQQIIKLLGKEEQSKDLALLILIPYLWERTDGTVKMSQEITDIMCSGNSLSDIVNPIYGRIKKHNLYLILKFFVQIAQHGSKYQRRLVYMMTTIFLEKNKEIHKELSELAYYSVIDKENETSTAVIAFLQKVQQLKINIKIFEKKQNKYLEFPDVKIIQEKISRWEPIIEDVFKDIENYPPVYINEISFCGCPIVKSIKEQIEKVKVVPFTLWSELLFQAQMQSVDNIDAEEKNVTIQLEPRKFMNELKDELEKHSEVFERQSINLNSPILSIINNQSNNSFSLIHSGLFIPDEGEILQIGKQIIDELVTDI